MLGGALTLTPCVGGTEYEQSLPLSSKDTKRRWAQVHKERPVRMIMSGRGAQSSGTGAKLDIFLSFMPYFMNKNGAGKASAATPPNILIAGPVTWGRQ